MHIIIMIMLPPKRPGKVFSTICHADGLVALDVNISLFIIGYLYYRHLSLEKWTILSISGLVQASDSTSDCHRTSMSAKKFFAIGVDWLRGYIARNGLESMCP